MSSGSKKNERRYYFLFSLKSPGKRTLFRFPNRAPMVRAVRLHAPFTKSLKMLINISLNDEIFSFLQRSQERSVPQSFPGEGPQHKQAPISTSLISITFGVPTKGVLLPGCPRRAPSDRKAPFLEPYIVHL